MRTFFAKFVLVLVTVVGFSLFAETANAQCRGGLQGFGAGGFNRTPMYQSYGFNRMPMYQSYGAYGGYNRIPMYQSYGAYGGFNRIQPQFRRW